LTSVTLSNPPGFSRPEMATLRELDLQLALLPLLHKSVQIDQLTLVQPDIRLETDAQGRPNWQFTPEAKPAAPAAPQTAEGQPSEPVRISVRNVQVSDGTLTWRDGRTGKVVTIGLRTLGATADGPDAPMHLQAEATANGAPFTVTGDTGPLSRLQDPAASSPWPIKLTLQASGGRATADGTVTQPLAGKGYAFAVDASIPDLGALAPLLPRAKLPPLRDVRLSAKVADSGRPMPAVSALTLQAGPSDLGSVRPGLRLESLDVAAPALDQPTKARVVARLGDTPVTVTATLGTPAQLLPGAPGPLPVDVAAESGGARLTAKGSVADPAALRGVALDVAATVPDLSALSGLANQPLPAVKTIAFQGRLTDADGGFGRGATLKGMTLTSSAGDAKGDLAVGLRLPVSVTANLTSSRIDADALTAARGKPLPPANEPPTGGA
ncbi:MAG: AsmA family protein, partial [Rhodospirillales bacterium]|nr:AsmA family protein [Rhodospirillales bacterium]